MKNSENYLSLDTLSKLRGNVLCSATAQDGSVHTLFSYASAHGLDDCTFGMRPKFPAFDDSEPPRTRES